MYSDRRKEFKSYLDDILNLRDEIHTCKEEGKAVSRLNDMSVLHGEAIFDNAHFKKRLLDLNYANEDAVTAEDFAELSREADELSCMCDIIKQTRKEYYNSEYSARTYPEIYSSIPSDASPGEYVISIEDIDTTEVDPNFEYKLENEQSPVIRAVSQGGADKINLKTAAQGLINKFNQGANKVSEETRDKLVDWAGELTDAVNKMDTEEADRLYNEREKKIKEFEKPTLVNYWADWCGYSNRFKPIWDKFKREAASVYPDLKIIDLNVSHDPELAKVAKSAGCESYPTIVLYLNGKIFRMKAGSVTEDGIKNFLSSHGLSK